MEEGIDQGVECGSRKGEEESSEIAVVWVRGGGCIEVDEKSR
jgi:hypothetical protein